MTSFKGPAFKSWTEPPPQLRGSRKGADTYLPHCGRQSNLRRLRQMCAHILKSNDPIVQATVERLREALHGDDSKILFILNKAREIEESSNISLDVALMILLDQVSTAKEEKT